ncbi:MAG: L-seryl-tRNA(Sec) selenium transferase [Armatimonadota bacterium]
MPTEAQRSALRRLPAVDEVLASDAAQEWLAAHPRVAVLQAIRAALSDLRTHVLAANTPEALDAAASGMAAIAESVATHLEAATRPSLRRVVNATGIIVHTGLGRSLLSAQAATAVQQAATGHCALEVDLESGERGSRQAHLEPLLCHLTGSDAALVVNNNAAAVLLVLNSLAEGKQIVVSRGELVEIGGSFRMPDVIAKSGCTMVEVGTTNRTHLADYQAAIGPETVALLRVHPSNYRVVGFTEGPSLEEMACLAGERRLLLIEDLGSGALEDLSRYGVGGEPVVQHSISAGVDVTTFSGDKVLGGPQAGVIVGRADLLERIRRNPLARALRVDKLTIAALEATLRLHIDVEQAFAEIPTLRAVSAPAPGVRERAEALAAALPASVADAAQVAIVETSAQVGGGALPTQEIPSWAVAVTPTEISADELARRLRLAHTAVMGRIQRGRLLLDMRTVADDELSAIASALAEALAAS